MVIRMRQVQLPLEVMRDLLGIARVLYVAWSAQGVSAARLAELRSVGGELRAALKLGAKTEPGTLWHRAAWGRSRWRHRAPRSFDRQRRTHEHARRRARERLLSGTRQRRR